MGTVWQRGALRNLREQSNLFYRRIFGTFTTCNLQTIKELIAIIEMICEFRWSDAFSGCYVVDIYHCNKNQGVVATCKSRYRNNFFVFYLCSRVSFSHYSEMRLNSHEIVICGTCSVLTENLQMNYMKCCFCWPYKGVSKTDRKRLLGCWLQD